MIKSLEMTNFTLFENHYKLPFSKGINVLIGENGTGKSHILKLGYTICTTSFDAYQSDKKTKEFWQKSLADKMVNVFKPDSLGRLVSRKQGRNKCSIRASFGHQNSILDYSFATNSKTEVQISQIPNHLETQAAVFIPPKELLTVYPGFAAMYRNRETAYDETYYDLCLLLENPVLQGRRSSDTTKLMANIQDVVGGTVSMQNGKFYVKYNDGRGDQEVHLVAEGLRKIALLQHLISNGSLSNQGILFWDEPEANLNPKLIRKMAELLINLASQGIQIFVATHSLIFLKEIDYLIHAKRSGASPHTKFFAFGFDEQRNLIISSGKSIEDVEPIVALETEIEQSELHYNLEMKA